MSGFMTIGHAVAASALCLALSVSAAHANTGAVFRDVLKPNGHVRTSREKLADGVACGTSAGAHHTLQVTMPVFEKCMRGKGWAFDHYVPDPSSRPRRGSVESYTDTHGDSSGKPRGTAALHADERVCKAQTRSTASARVNQCLAAHGWTFMYAQHAPASRVAAQPQRGWSANWNGSGSATSSNDDEFRRIDEQNRTMELNQMMQSQGDATGAATAAQGEQQIQNSFMPQ